MINMLPTDYRLRLRYGRLNSNLRHWLEMGVLMLGGLILILGLGWLYIDKQIKDLNNSVSQIQTQLQNQNLEEVQKQADQISQNVHIINQVLGREIRFSDLIQEIGKVMPPGTVLGSLTLSKINGALDLTANAKDYASATQIAVNLSDPKNNIFEKVDIINIGCSATASTYPCSANFKALFGKNTPTRFLNVASGAQ